MCVCNQLYCQHSAKPKGKSIVRVWGGWGVLGGLDGGNVGGSTAGEGGSVGVGVCVCQHSRYKDKHSTQAWRGQAESQCHGLSLFCGGGGKGRRAGSDRRQGRGEAGCVACYASSVLVTESMLCVCGPVQTSSVLLHWLVVADSVLCCAASCCVCPPAAVLGRVCRPAACHGLLLLLLPGAGPVQPALEGAAHE